MILCAVLNCSVVSDSLWPHELQPSRLPCPSLSPGVCSNSSPLSQWCQSNHLILSHPLLLLPQSFPALGTFPMSWLFASRGQSVGASASEAILPMNIQGWFPLRLTGLISLLSRGLSRVFSSTTVWKRQFFSLVAGTFSWVLLCGRCVT